jgi:hypothetical protein
VAHWSQYVTMSSPVLGYTMVYMHFFLALSLFIIPIGIELFTPAAFYLIP